MPSAFPPAFRQINVILGASLPLLRGLNLILMTNYDMLSLLFKRLNLILYLKTLNSHLCYFLLNIAIFISFSTYFLDSITSCINLPNMTLSNMSHLVYITHFVKQMVWHYRGLIVEWSTWFERVIQSLFNTCLFMSIFSTTLNHIPLKYRRPMYCYVGIKHAYHKLIRTLDKDKYGGLLSIFLTYRSYP